MQDNDTSDGVDAIDIPSGIDGPDALDSPVELDTPDRKADLGVGEIDDAESDAPSTYGAP
jgi:hypothetical protein